MKNLHPQAKPPTIYKAPVQQPSPMKAWKFFGLLFGIPATLLVFNIGAVYLSTTPEQRSENTARAVREKAELKANLNKSDMQFNMDFECKSAVKQNLRNPNSYEVMESHAYVADNFALVKYRAENGFGGLNNAIAQCNFIGNTMMSLDMNKGDSEPPLPIRN